VTAIVSFAGKIHKSEKGGANREGSGVLGGRWSSQQRRNSRRRVLEDLQPDDRRELRAEERIIR